MPDRFSRSSVHLDTGSETSPAHVVPDPDTPFQILIVGDFSGRANRGVSASLAGRKPVQVDCDNFEEVLARMKPSLQLPKLRLSFKAIEEFHPDWIYQNAEMFQRLAEIRNQPPPDSRKPISPVVATPAPIPGGADLLDSALSQTEKRQAELPKDPGDLSVFLKGIVAPHLVERPAPEQEEWASRVDGIAAEQMRAVLHHQHFQGLEAAWRAVWLLIQRLNPDSDLKIFLLDATVEELLADHARVAEILAGETWAAIVGNFVFGQTDEDAAKLLRLGRAARSAQATFLAEALPPADSQSAAWEQLRHTPEAGWIGLSVPRFLLRLPYGRETTPAEAFNFEEMPESVHACYLWGNPAFACACLLGLAFRSHGWEMRPGSHRELGELPQHVYTEEGQSVAKPCAEVLLTETEAEFLMESGFMPLASMKGQDSVLLVRFQSTSDPPSALAGRWVS